MTDRNGRQMIEDLKRTRPNVAITIERTADSYSSWDGDEEIDRNVFSCYDHTVTAACIVDGQLIEGTATLGGSWYDVTDYSADNQANLSEINGYLPQMIDEALEEMDAEVKRERVNAGKVTR